ncbi:bucky ball-like isoform X2 [Syngnathus scovelli]|uniref:bucky ball-like isoform X2 n=1 Tax=Syngnathus scovelli TaxID=161590 RepID=UPI00210F864A|nr:bucky ball-like isoform X2 [Syngnathus scovelli]
MEDEGRQSQSCGNEQQTIQHSRPFFYVQPPSQPYYLYQQWPMQNPYSHYGLQAGFHFGRPYMSPQYMPYPGLVVPHPPLHPMDYRRMFEPRFYPPTWNDDGSRPPHQQAHGQRQTANSEVQTEPCGSINKLVEFLEKMELDSGMASHSSGTSLPLEEKKGEEQCVAHLLTQVMPACSESQAVAFSDSTTAVYGGETSHMSLDASSPQAYWPGGLEVASPLDSSSFHEDSPHPENSTTSEPFLAHNKSDAENIQSEFVASVCSPPKSDADPSPSLSPSSEKPDGEESFDKVLSDVETDYKILQLPLQGVLSTGAASRFSSSSSLYYQNHRPSGHERVSVLSPSLDELSSRDEMFSTDLEDVDLYPQRAYSGRRMTKVAEAERASEEVPAAHVWLPNKTNKRLKCNCCGASLPKGGTRSKVHTAKVYRDEAATSEEDDGCKRGCEPSRAPPRNYPPPGKSHLDPQKQPVRFWNKWSHYKDPMQSTAQGYDNRPGETGGRELQFRTYQERGQHGMSEPSKRNVGSGAIPRRWPTSALQRQELSMPRAPMTPPRPRRDDDSNDDNYKELPSLPWDKV